MAIFAARRRALAHAAEACFYLFWAESSLSAGRLALAPVRELPQNPFCSCNLPEASLSNAAGGRLRAKLDIYITRGVKSMWANRGVNRLRRRRRPRPPVGRQANRACCDAAGPQENGGVGHVRLEFARRRRAAAFGRRRVRAELQGAAKASFFFFDRAAVRLVLRAL